MSRDQLQATYTQRTEHFKQAISQQSRLINYLSLARLLALVATIWFLALGLKHQGQGRALSGCGQCAGIAVCEHAKSVLNKGLTILSDAQTHVHVFATDGLRLLEDAVQEGIPVCRGLLPHKPVRRLDHTVKGPE